MAEDPRMGLWNVEGSLLKSFASLKFTADGVNPKVNKAQRSPSILTLALERGFINTAVSSFFSGGRAGLR